VRVPPSPSESSDTDSQLEMDHMATTNIMIANSTRGRRTRSNHDDDEPFIAPLPRTMCPRYQSQSQSQSISISRDPTTAASCVPRQAFNNGMEIGMRRCEPDAMCKQTNSDTRVHIDDEVFVARSPANQNHASRR